MGGIKQFMIEQMEAEEAAKLEEMKDDGGTECEICGYRFKSEFMSTCDECSCNVCLYHLNDFSGEDHGPYWCIACYKKIMDAD